MPPGLTEPRPATGASDSRTPAWTGRAFGIDLHANFRAAGIVEQAGPTAPHEDDGVPARRSHLQLVSDVALEAAWPAAGTRTLGYLHDDEGRSVLTIAEHPDAGFRLEASYYGRFVVSADGGRVLCAPTPVADWEWQAFVVGQILPLLVVLHGLEGLHGSAVSFADDAIGLVASSCGGKSSLAVNLVRRGAAFAADDVLALERDGAGTALHPGPALASVRHAEADVIGPAGLAELGTVVGRNDHELRLAMQRDARPLNLAALYFIERAEHEPSLTIEAIEPDPLQLLSGSHNAFVRTAERLVGQLDLYAHVSRSVPAFRAVVWPGIDAYGLACLIQDHALQMIAGSS